jgi:hypothetical protein
VFGDEFGDPDDLVGDGVLLAPAIPGKVVSAQLYSSR